MTTHYQRLTVLAEALRVPPSMVVSRLRARNVMYVGAGGALLFNTSADWSDERIVEAAFQLFVAEGNSLGHPARRSEPSQKFYRGVNR